MSELQSRIEALWEGRDSLSADDSEVVATVHEAIAALDTGMARVAEWNPDGSVTVNQWCKYAVLLLFKISKMETIEHTPLSTPTRFAQERLHGAQCRVVPGAQARWGSYQAPGVVMMPSYVNIGAYVDENSMVDTWATVGSCAQIGKNVHLSGGVGIGGVLEPPQAEPVIVEDDCLIGSRCIVAEGARVGQGVVLGAGCILTGSMPVIDVETGEELGRGEVPSWCVAVAGTRPKRFAGVSSDFLRCSSSSASKRATTRQVRPQ